MYDHLCQLPKKGVSTKIQDYMHVPNFKEVVATTRSIQDLVQISPVSLVKFSKELQRDLLIALVGGADLKTALRMCRVTEANYNTWVKLAGNYVEPFMSFILECEAAQGFFDMELIQFMRTRPMGAIELWKIRHPESQPGAPGANGTINQTINVNFADLTPQERREAIVRNSKEIDMNQVIDLPVKDD